MAHLLQKNFEGGVHYDDCQDPTMVDITICLNRISSSRDPNILNVTTLQEKEYLWEKGTNVWSQNTTTPIFVVDCDGSNVLSACTDNSTEGTNETIQVNDGATCTMDTQISWATDEGGKSRIENGITRKVRRKQQS